MKAFTHFLGDALNQLSDQLLARGDQGLLLAQTLQVAPQGALHLLLASMQLPLLGPQGAVTLQQLVQGRRRQLLQLQLALLLPQKQPGQEDAKLNSRRSRRSRRYLQVLHGVQLAAGRGDQGVDRELRSAPEQLLARGVAHGARSVAHDVVRVPRVRIHVGGAVSDGLTAELSYVCSRVLL